MTYDQYQFFDCGVLDTTTHSASADQHDPQQSFVPPIPQSNEGSNRVLPYSSAAPVTATHPK